MIPYSLDSVSILLKNPYMHFKNEFEEITVINGLLGTVNIQPVKTSIGCTNHY